MNITGIEELREAIRYCGITKELYGEKFQAAKFKLMKVATPELLSSILDQLEAERQRADDAFILIGYAEDGKGFVYEPRHQDRISNPIAIYRRKES